MITVIIPTYNRKEPVREAVESVLAQEDAGDAVEIIVVDDGSTDGTHEALARFGDRIASLRQDRSGVSATRNLGISHAKGEWLAFLDSDDLWRPGKLAAQVRFFSDNPEMRICQTEEIWLRNGKRLNPCRYHEKPEGHCFSKLLERCLVSPSAVMIHRGVFDEVGLFDPSLPACEDFDMWLRIGCRFPLGLVTDPLVIKRGGHPDQLSATVPALDRYRIQAIANLLKSAPLAEDQRAAARTALIKKCRIYAGGCRKRGKNAEADRIDRLAGEVLDIGT